jgi:hypothetical protein
MRPPDLRGAPRPRSAPPSSFSRITDRDDTPLSQAKNGGKPRLLALFRGWRDGCTRRLRLLLGLQPEATIEQATEAFKAYNAMRQMALKDPALLENRHFCDLQDAAYARFRKAYRRLPKGGGM